MRSSPKIKNIYVKKMFIGEQKIMKSAGVQVKGNVIIRIRDIWKSQLALTRSTGQEKMEENGSVTGMKKALRVKLP